MNLKRNLLLGLSMLSILPMLGQTTKEEIFADLNKAGGVYYAYPVTESHNTPAPKGYEPVYISHYGRHGSRYLIGDADYTVPAQLLRKAKAENAITPLGEDVLARLDSLYKEVRGRSGDLSPLGNRQHKAIAKRMYDAYPEVFKGDKDISARSTVVVRCVLSMAAFCESLKEQNPKLNISRDASHRDMDILNYHSPEEIAYASEEWVEQYNKFERRHVDGQRLAESLFSDPKFIEKNVNVDDLMWKLYFVAVGMQDIETELDFFDLFTPEELFNVWQAFNYRFYACDGNFGGNRGLPVQSAKRLLNDIITLADEGLASDNHAADLRFGHDGNVIPLVALMQIKGASEIEDEPEKIYETFSDFKIVPMAANFQMIFFRNKKNPDDVIVKIMLNETEREIPVETDIAPFYHWNDVRDFYRGIIND